MAFLGALRDAVSDETRIHLQLRLEGKFQKGVGPGPSSAESRKWLREMFWPLGHLQTPRMQQHPRIFCRAAPLQMGRREGAPDKIPAPSLCSQCCSVITSSETSRLFSFQLCPCLGQSSEETQGPKPHPDSSCPQ